MGTYFLPTSTRSLESPADMGPAALVEIIED
jgi:hypothetical protein